MRCVTLVEQQRREKEPKQVAEGHGLFFPGIQCQIS
jgi:hypothetical protein